MNKPTIDELLARVNNRYTLVVLAAKRARALTAEEDEEREKAKKQVSVALEEIAQGRVTYQEIKGNRHQVGW